MKTVFTFTDGGETGIVVGTVMKSSSTDGEVNEVEIPTTKMKETAGVDEAQVGSLNIYNTFLIVWPLGGKGASLRVHSMLFKIF